MIFSLELIGFPENKGIASAQNAGISRGIAKGMKYILLMDQDTVLPGGTVRALQDGCNILESQKIKVGAIGCAYRDTHDGRLNVILKAKGLRIEQQIVNPDTETLLATDCVIASGSLIPAATLNEVGLMDEDLFIDLVDVEWGLRAKAHGYQSYLSFTKIMSHTLGQGRLKILWKTVPLHSPARNYYAVRNSLILARRRYIDAGWRLYFVKRLFPYLIGFGLFAPQKKRRINFMMRGLSDGFHARGGPYRA